MTIGLVGRKVGMTRIFTDEGDALPVTVLDVSDNRIAQIKTPDRDGYAAVQVAFGKRRANRVSKPLAGHLAKAGHRVTVYNRTGKRAQAWVKQHGGRLAPTPAAAAKNADVVFSCVGNDDHLRDVVSTSMRAIRKLGIRSARRRSTCCVPSPRCRKTAPPQRRQVVLGSSACWQSVPG